jgi:nitroreductase
VDNPLLEFLQQRKSAPRLTGPAPDEAQLHNMLRAAARAPDHALLRPWRFISIRGERRHALGEVLARCLRRRNPDADQAALDKARQSPLRAPLLVVVVARISEHPRVPASEQRLSAGCAAHGLLLAAEALGFAGIWRTGDAAFDRVVMDTLGLASNEEITGFLYLGTRDGVMRPVPELAVESCLSDW